MALEFVHIWWVETSQASLALEVIFGISFGIYGV